MRILLDTLNDSVEPTPIFAAAVDLTDEVNVERAIPQYVGPYSFVYRGTCRGVTVAVKVIQSVGNSLRTMRRKVDRERAVWASLSHPNMVPLFGYTEPSDLFGPFGAFISPWYSNGDAAKFIQSQESSLPSEYRINLWRGVIAGVAYLHGYDPVIVHGDLKSSNVLVDNYCNAQICDFGLSAVLAQEGPSGLTTTSPYTGTERYISPELLLDHVDPTPTTASDVWAIGCIGLEFIFLQLPYQSRKKTRPGLLLEDIRAGILPGQKLPLRGQPDYENIWQIMEGCWIQEPHHRPTASRLLEDLDIAEMEDLHGSDIGNANWDDIAEQFRRLTDHIYSLVSSIMIHLPNTSHKAPLPDHIAQRFTTFPASSRFIQFLQLYHPAYTVELALKLLLRNYLSQRLLDDIFNPFSPGNPSPEDKEWTAHERYLQKTELQSIVGGWRAKNYLVLQSASPLSRYDIVESLLIGINYLVFQTRFLILTEESLDDLIPRIWHLVDTAMDFKYAAQVKCTDFSFEVYSGEKERADPNYVESLGNQGATNEAILPIGLGLRALKTIDIDGALELVFYPVQKALVIFDNWEPSVS